MADADVPITPGSGTKIDTRTVGAGTDEHRQVVVVGDPTTAANVAAVSAAGRVSVDGSGVTQPVSGTFWQATQPVSLASAVSIGAGAATIGTVLNVGDVDHDAVNTGKVVQTGGHASPQGTPPTAVSAAGDRVRTWQDLNGAQIIRPRKSATYKAVYRTTTAGSRILAPAAFTAGGRKQFATIHHAATATKTVRLRSVTVQIESVSVASRVFIDLVRITAAPATGNPAITPGIAENSDAAAEATCLALPTTAGTEGTVYATQEYNLGITGAQPTTSPPPAIPKTELLSRAAIDGEMKAPTIRAGVLEGWAVTIEAGATPVVQAIVEIEFAEE